MKKKLIGGALLVVFIGTLGFFTVSEAIGMVEENRMINEMDRRSERSRASEERDQTDDFFDKREQRRQNHMGEINQKSHYRVNRSCW